MNLIFGAKTTESTPVATATEAPYKVEPVVPAGTEATITVVPVAVADTPLTTAVLEVKSKFKKADLEKQTKAELLALAQERGLEVKARAVKADLIKALLKS
jgi:hypothetical protein